MSTSTSTVTSAPVQPVPAPEPAPAPKVLTNEEKVIAAANKLSMTAIDSYRIECETSTYGVFARIGYIFVRIAYALGIGELAGADKEFGATVKEFQTAKEQLINAVAARGYTIEEAALLKANPAHSSADITAIETASQKLDAFYAVFKKRCSQVKIDENHADFGVYAAGVQKLIENTSDRKSITTVEKLNEKIFNDCVETFAAKSLDDFAEGFAKKVADLNGIFPALVADKDQNVVEIEARLRQGIKAKHSKEEFDKKIAEFTNASPKAARFVQAKAKIEADSKAEKTKLEAEIKKLCGKGYGDKDSDLHKAWETLEKAAQETAKAKADYVVAFKKLAADVDGLDGDELVEQGSKALANNAIEGEVNMNYLNKVVVDYKAKLAASNEKKKAYETLEEQRNKIAGAGNLHGRLREVNDILNGGSARAATQHLEKMAKLYGELSKPVGDVNKDSLSRDLHKIIDEKNKK